MTGARVPLYGWLTAEAISVTGTRVSMIAIPWFVLTTTGSPTQTGLVAMAELVPMVLLKVLGGPVIDRVGARRVSVGCDAGSMVVVGLVPVLYAAGSLPFELLLALVAVAGGLRGPGDAAKQALVPTLVEHAGVPMERATGLFAAVERGASMLGSAFAGVLVVFVGPANALYVDALSFGVSAAVLWASTRRLAVSANKATASEDDGAGGSYLHRLGEGWHFLVREPVLLAITAMVAVTNLIDIAYTTVLLPVWAKETGGGAAILGLIFAVKNGASILGALTAARWGDRLPRYRTYLVAFILGGAPKFLVLAWGVPLWAVIVVCVVSGAASGFLNPILGAVIFERIPVSLVGRVSSLTTAMCFALMPLGGVVAGLLIGGPGLSAALVICGAAYLVTTMAPTFVRPFRSMDDRRAPAREPLTV